MDRSKRRKKQDSIIESDEEGATGIDNDTNWVLEAIDDDQHQVFEIETPLSDDSEFDSTEGFQLKTVKSSKQSNHRIWTRFGQLIKNEKTVASAKDRIYCISCFENKKFKRQVNSKFYNQCILQLIEMNI